MRSCSVSVFLHIRIFLFRIPLLSKGIQELLGSLEILAKDFPSCRALFFSSSKGRDLRLFVLFEDHSVGHKTEDCSVMGCIIFV